MLLQLGVSYLICLLLLCIHSRRQGEYGDYEMTAKKDVYFSIIPSLILGTIMTEFLMFDYWFYGFLQFMLLSISLGFSL